MASFLFGGRVSGYPPKTFTLWDSGTGHSGKEQERKRESGKRLVKEVGTEAVIGIGKTVANIPGQNSCDLNMCHLPVVSTVTARALEPS